MKQTKSDFGLTKKQRLILLIGVSPLFLFMLGNITYSIYVNSTTTWQEQKNISNKRLNYQGIILDKYYDPKNHNAKSIRVINNGKELIAVLNIDSSTIVWNYIKAGDSIIKIENSLLISVYRNNQLKKFNIDLTR